MSIRAKLFGYRWFNILRNAAIRTGVYAGVCLAVVLTTWLILANRVPFLERFAKERNLAAAAVLLFLAMVPVMRFFRLPSSLLLSGLIAWSILAVAYRILCLFFAGLSDWHSTFQIFTIGALIYLIVTTLSWLGTMIWRTRASHVAHSHSRHHVS